MELQWRNKTVVCRDHDWKVVKQMIAKGNFPTPPDQLHSSPVIIMCHRFNWTVTQVNSYNCKCIDALCRRPGVKCYQGCASANMFQSSSRREHDISSRIIITRRNATTFGNGQETGRTQNEEE